MRLCKKNKLFVTLSLLFPTLLNAEPIQPDRPGFSTGTYTVAPGFSHIEMGVQTDYGNQLGDPDSYTAPLINYRTGLTPNTEFNLLWDGWSVVEGDRQNNTINDVFVGIKHRLVVSDLYNISVLGFLSLPTGNSTDAGHSTPFLGLLWDYAINDQILAFGTLQFISFVENEQRSNNFQPAIGFSFTHTETISTFIEYYNDISINLDTQKGRVVDTGIAYLLTPTIQLDFNAGFSLDKYSSDFMGVGIAVRF